MIVGILGNGARESAFIISLLTDPAVEKIIWPNPNGGFLDEPRVQREVLSEFNPQAVTELFLRNKVTLALSGPEAMAIDGINDSLTENGIAVLGASKAAVQIEADKAWAREFMTKLDIPQPQVGIFTDAESAIKAAEKNHSFRVVKATGPAGGKGVIVCDTLDETKTAIQSVLVDKRFGDAGSTIVLEERLGWKDKHATEISMMFYTDGSEVVPLPLAQDYKREGDGDVGENTGGMGTHTSPKILSTEAKTFVQEKIAKVLLTALAAHQRKFVGILYVGLMKTTDKRHNKHGLFVIEINGRGGDPETVVQLAGQHHPHIGEFYLACAQGSLKKVKPPTFNTNEHVDLVLCAHEYPRGGNKGSVITGLDDCKDVTIIHAGTTAKDNQVLTNGGRILGILASAPTRTEACHRVYAAASCISVDGKPLKYRHDIGKRAL